MRIILGFMTLVLVGWGTPALAAETFSCEAIADAEGCGYGMAMQFEGAHLMTYFELQVVCADRPGEVRTLVQNSSGIYSNPSFRPRYDSRYIGWTQFVVEGLSTGQRAVVLVAPRTAGASFMADLRLATPGSTASTILQLNCTGN